MKLVFFLLSLHALALAETPRPLMKDFIGLNGHTVQFKPELYQPTANLVRDYHPISWDLDKDTSLPAPFPFAKNRVNWETVYGSWKRHQWTTNACLMFDRMKLGDWKNLNADAQRYGERFAHEFGPSGARNLVQSVEIGNEPGEWNDDEYSAIFKAMAAGIREGDPKINIATCNLTTGPSGKYEKSVSCIANHSDLVDVLSIHTYAQLENWPTWKRSYPEDPALPKYLKDVENLCAWRDKHMPTKPIWITEFGYDSTTKPQEKEGTFSKWQGITDEQQAQWIVRSLLVFSSMPVERAYIYFFNDSNEAKLHASSGLTRNFKPKPSFHAVAHLQKTLGDFRFSRIVTNEPGRIRIHEYQNGSDSKKITWAVWRPDGEATSQTTKLTHLPGKLVSSSKMPLSDRLIESIKTTQADPKELDIAIDGAPLYLTFKRP